MGCSRSAAAQECSKLHHPYDWAVVEADGNSRALKATERDQLWEKLAQDRDCLSIVNIRVQQRQIAYHVTSLRRALMNESCNLFVADFHNGWLKKLGIDTAEFDDKLEELKKQTPATKRD